MDGFEGIFNGRELEFKVEFVDGEISGVVLVEDGGLELCVPEFIEVDSVEHEIVFD